MKSVPEGPLIIFGGLTQNLVRLFGFVQDLLKGDSLLQRILNKIDKSDAATITVFPEVSVNSDMCFVHGWLKHSIIYSISPKPGPLGPVRAKRRCQFIKQEEYRYQRMG
jgi:hypothetical protein